MAVAIQLLGLVDGTSLPKYDGKYVVSYEPMKWSYRDVASVEQEEKLISEWLVVTDEPAKAKQFPSMVEAHAFWTQLGPGVRPWDGKPNKPLTAFSVTMAPVDTLKRT